MKKILAVLLTAALVLSLAACGGSSKPDPNEGVYKATSGEYGGISISIDKVFDGGFTLQLKSGGRAVLTTGGEDYNLKWSLDGKDFTLTASDSEYTGTLADGVLTLRNVLDSGVNMTLEKTD